MVNMRKGLAVESTGKLFLVMICALVLASVLFFWVLPVGIPMVTGWLESLGIIPGEGSSVLEKAVLCSYHRCVDGCTNMPDEVSNYEICTMVDGACDSNEPITYCKQDFCDSVPDAFKKGTTKAICGDDAETYPVTLSVEGDTVSKSGLGATCIATDDSWFDAVVGAVNHWFIFIDESLIDDPPREKCDYAGLGLGLNDAIIETAVFGDVYIHTYRGVPPVANPPGDKRGTITTHVDYQFCRDSDGGRNIRQKGICSDADGDNTDVCVDVGRINEFRCSDDGKECLMVDPTTTPCPEGSSCVDGACVNYLLPEAPDDWTEEQADIDCCWSGDPIPAIPNGLKLDEDSQSRVNSIYIETWDVLFSIYNAIGVPIDNLDDWDELRFWFKDSQSGPLVVSFDAEDGLPLDKDCYGLEAYDASLGWKKYTVNIADCGWSAGVKPIKSIMFSLETPDFIMRSNIDGMYFCKGDGCQIDAPPPEETCDDSDGGNNPVGEQGTCTDNSGDHPDSCKDGTTVTEYECVDNTCEPRDIPCSSGYVCVDGVCETPVSFELFENDKFGGESVLVTSPVSDLGDYDFDNKALSIKVPDGWMVTLYDETMPGGGKEITIAGDSSSLWFGDRAKSIKIEGSAGCQAVLYGDENYEGKEKVVDSDIPDLEAEVDDPPCCRTNMFGCWWHCWDAVVSSIKVDPGCEVTLYKDKDYGEDTGYIVLSGSSSSLHFQNRASSLTGFKA